MNVMYGIGMICGIFIVVIIAGVIWRLLIRGKRKPVYDERQQLEQGKAAKVGFYTLMALNVMYAIAEEFLGLKLGAFEGVLLTIIISVGIYGIVCIWKEAYFPINQSSRRWIAGLFAIGIMNLIGGYNSMTSNSEGFHININYACALLMFAVTIISIIKLKLISKVSSDEEDNDEESEA